MNDRHPKDCISRKIMKCNRIIGSIFRKYILPFGISNSQLSVLFVTSKAGLVTQTKLAEVLYLEKSTVSRNVRILIQKGLLEKTKQQIQMTKKGSTLLVQIIPEWEKAMQEARMILTAEGEDALNLVLYRLSR